MLRDCALTTPAEPGMPVLSPQSPPLHYSNVVVIITQLHTNNSGAIIITPNSVSIIASHVFTSWRDTMESISSSCDVFHMGTPHTWVWVCVCAQAPWTAVQLSVGERLYTHTLDDRVRGPRSNWPAHVLVLCGRYKIWKHEHIHVHITF